MEKQVPCSVYLTKSTKERLEAVASQYGARQFNRVVNDAVREYLERKERGNEK